MASAAYMQWLRIAMIPGGIGYLELLLLFALILVLFGPDRLPGIARKLGHLAEQLRKAASLFQHNLLAMEEANDVPDADDPDSIAEDYDVAKDEDAPDADDSVVPSKARGAEGKNELRPTR